MTGSAALGVEIPPSDRWVAASSRPPQSKATAAIVLASTLAHAAILSLLLIGGPAKGGAPNEVSVELVEAPPKPEPKAPEPKPAPQPEPPKQEPPKQQAEKPVPPPEPARPEPAKVAAAPEKAAPAAKPAPTAKAASTAKAEASKPRPPEPTRQAQAAAPKPSAPKPPAPKAEPPAAPKPPPSQPAATTAQLDQLKRQLVDELLQQHAAAETERHVVRPETASATSSKPSGFTSDAKSLLPIALPGTGDGDGEAVGFEDLVFSQLAKAKDLSRRRGLPGTAGVRFTVDDHGGLSNVELIRPSGDKALDEEATSIVRRAAPFPVPPKGVERTFAISVDFVPDD